MIASLRQRKPGGQLYKRVETIEAKLVELEGLPRDELADRCAIRSRGDAGYVPTECLLHFVRASRQDNSEAWFERLYKLLLARVMGALPNPKSGDGETSSLTKERVRDKVLDRFMELLAGDRQVYEERLDFFEIRFDRALKLYRMDAEKQAWRDENRTRALEYDDDTGDLSPEVAAAAGFVDPYKSAEFLDEASRLRLDAAIATLPPEQSRTFHMLRLGYQMHSTDPEVMTIAKALGVKSPKTIWNYRDRAIKALRQAMLGEEDGL